MRSPGTKGRIRLIRAGKYTRRLRSEATDGLPEAGATGTDVMPRNAGERATAPRALLASAGLAGGTSAALLFLGVQCFTSSRPRASWFVSHHESRQSAHNEASHSLRVAGRRVTVAPGKQ